ncbi:MAG: prepilin-type N-terminal cleavage/methylation domain-containing protein, partial [Acidobacteriota bacterium]|nr:prepilin-type N-terminal cleavage/methylation domain-containing protein [Acidobacteriota bacterium]
MRSVHTRLACHRAGFTLIEMVIAMFILSLLVVGLLEVFDFSSKVARSQTNISDMQQSLRAAQYDVVRLIRMAGRGPLPLRTPGRQMPLGVALEVRNNVPANSTIGFVAGTGPAVLTGTDILTIRGVFNSSLYQVNYGDPATFSLNATGGSVVIADKSPTGVPHDLGPMVAAICDTDDVPEALLLVSPLDDAIYAVVELNAPGSRSSVDCTDPSANTSMTVQFKTAAGDNVTEYLALSAGGAYPAGLTSAAFVGILEEYRFYIREIYAIAGDTTSDLTPRFAKARVFPGTDIPYANDPVSWTGDIADNLIDFQVVLGVDGDNDGVILDQGDSSDEWLFNDPNDNAGDAKWNQVQPASVPAVESRLYNVRLTTLARTDRRDTSFQAP